MVGYGPFRSLGEDVGTGIYVPQRFLGRSVSFDHCLDGLGVLLGQPAGLDVFIKDIEVVVAVFGEQEEDGWVFVAVVHAHEAVPFGRNREGFDYVLVVAEAVEELAGGDFPVAVAVGAQFPAGVFFEFTAVVGVDDGVVFNGGGDEAGVGFLLVAVGVDEAVLVPDMADATGVGGGVDAGPEVFAGAVGVAQGAVFGIGKGGGFFDEDDVVFEAEVLVDVVFVAEVADDDAGAVGEGDEAFGPDVAVWDSFQDYAAEVVGLFAGLFGGEAEVEGFEAGDAAAVVEGELGEGGVGFAGAAGAAEADLGWAIGAVTEAGGCVEFELFALGDVAGGDKVFELFGREVERARGFSETVKNMFSWFTLHRRCRGGGFSLILRRGPASRWKRGAGRSSWVDWRSRRWSSDAVLR